MASSAIVGILRALLTADTASFDSAMKRSGESAKALSRDLRQVGQQMTQVGSALTKTLTLPLVALGVGAAKAAMDFETSFANVRKTVDATDKQLDELAKTFRQMAKEIPATTDELNKIAALGGQMGVPIDQLAHFTRNVAALGVAVDGINTDDAAAGLAQIGNATGTGTTKIAEMASALVHLGNKSNATEADILEFTKRLVGAGHSVGMTVPDIMALGTAMANVGINAEAGGTAMSTVISKISKAVSQGGESLKEFARVAQISAEEFSATWKRSPIEAMDLFVKGLSSIRERGIDLNLTMGEIGTEGLRVADTLKRLAGAGDGVAKSMVIANEGFSSGNKHLEEAEKKYKTVENQLKLLWNQIKDVGITIGDALLPAIRSLIDLTKTLLPAIDNLGKMFAGLPAPIQLGIIGIAGLVAAAGPMLFIFGQLALSASSLTGAFAKNGIAMTALAGSSGFLTSALGFLMNPITLIVGGLGLLALGIYKAATAETELEKSLRSNTQAFKDNTKQLDAALSTYQSLVGKQNLTKEETIRLDAATRELAKASGLSVEGFKNEEAGSNTLTSALREQLKARKELLKEAIEQARGRWMEAAAEVAKAQEILNKTLTGKAVSVGVGGPGSAPGITAMTSAQRVQEVERLNGVIGDLTKRAGEAEAAYKGMAGAVSANIHLASEWAGPLQAAAVQQQKLTTTTKASQADIQKALKETGRVSEELAKQFDEQRKALESLGILTKDSVNKQFHELNQLWSRAIADGVQLTTLVRLLGPSYQELADKAKRSDVVLEGLNETLALQASIIPRIPSLSATIGGDLTSLLKVGVVLKDITVGSMEAMRANILSAQSFQAVGVETVSIWKTQIFPGIKGVIDNLTAALNGSFAQMLLGAKGFKDGFLDILKSFAAAAVNIVNQVINGFTNALMKGISGALSGQAGAWSKAFQGLAMGVGGAASAGVGATGLAASTVNVGGGFAGSFGTAAGAGLSTTAIVATAGIGAAVIAAWAIYKNNKNDTKKVREAFAEALGFKDLSKLYTQLATMGTRGQELQNIGQNVIGKKDQAANKKWMEDVERFMHAVENFTSIVTSATGSIAAGFTGKISALFQKQTKDQLKTYDDLITAAAGNAEEVKRIEAEKAQFIKDTQASIVASTQEEFDRISRITLGSYTAARAQGQSAVQAIQTIGPAIDELASSAEQFGFAGNAAFNELLKWRDLVQANAPLLNQAQSLADLMQVLADTGNLDKKMFEDLQAQGLATYQSLLDAGFTEKQAREAIKPLILEEIRLAKEKGLEIDKGTAAIIKQMRANGELAENEKGLIDVFKEGFGALLKFLKVDLPAGWAATAKAAEDAASVTEKRWGGMRFRVPVDFEQGSFPSPPGGTPTVPGLASGGIVTRPSFWGIGEAGPEAVIPLSKLNEVMGGGASMANSFKIDNHHHIYFDGRQMTAQLVQFLKPMAKRVGVRPI